MGTVSEYGEKYFFLNYKQLRYFSYYKIIFFSFCRKVSYIEKQMGGKKSQLCPYQQQIRTVITSLGVVSQHSKQLLMSCIYNPPALLESLGSNPLEKDKAFRDVRAELTTGDATLGQGSAPSFCL